MATAQKQQKDQKDVIPARLISDRDTASYIGVSVDFLRKHRSEGNRQNRTIGPPFVKFGRSVRYDITDLDAWIEANKRR